MVNDPDNTHPSKFAAYRRKKKIASPDIRGAKFKMQQPNKGVIIRVIEKILYTYSTGGGGGTATSNISDRKRYSVGNILFLTHSSLVRASICTLKF